MFHPLLIIWRAVVGSIGICCNFSWGFGFLGVRNDLCLAWNAGGWLWIHPIVRQLFSVFMMLGSVLWWNGRLNIVKSSKNISPPRPEGVRQKWWFAQLNCWSVMLQISINCAGEVIISRLNNLTRICIHIYIFTYNVHIYIFQIYIYIYVYTVSM